MDSEVPDKEHERQPLQSEDPAQVDQNVEAPPENSAQDPNLTAQSLIRHTEEVQDQDLVSPYNVDPNMITNAYENPYKETTSASQSFIRRVPSSDLVPQPFTKFKHILILSFVAMALFFFIGFFAFRLAKNARKQHSKGLYGLAQRDGKKSVILSYLSITLGVLFTIVFIVLLAMA